MFLSCIAKEPCVGMTDAGHATSCLGASLAPELRGSRPRRSRTAPVEHRRRGWRPRTPPLLAPGEMIPLLHVGQNPFWLAVERVAVATPTGRPDFDDFAFTHRHVGDEHAECPFIRLATVDEHCLRCRGVPALDTPGRVRAAVPEAPRRRRRHTAAGSCAGCRDSRATGHPRHCPGSA